MFLIENTPAKEKMEFYEVYFKYRKDLKLCLKIVINLKPFNNN